MITTWLGVGATWCGDSLVWGPLGVGPLGVGPLGVGPLDVGAIWQGP